MRSGVFAIGVSCLCFALGCSSDSGSTDGGSSGKSTAGASSNQAGADAGGATGTSGSAAQAGTTATSGGSSAGAPEVPATEACKTYCTCHEKNCATFAIPGGKSCAAFCAGMTADQLACRQNMCKLVPDQPDNDHCTHSLGINQCE